jgi:arabinose-5-phosphate isomerase
VKTPEYIEVAQSAMMSVARATRDLIPVIGSDGFQRLVIGMDSPIALTGIGKSGLVAQRAAASWSSMGVRSSFVHPVDGLHGDASVIPRAGVLVALTQSGNTAEVMRFTDWLVKDRDVAVILVTSNPGSWDARLPWALIDTGVEYEGNRIGFPLVSCHAQAAILDAALVAWCHAHGKTNQDLKTNHPGGTIGEG